MALPFPSRLTTRFNDRSRARLRRLAGNGMALLVVALIAYPLVEVLLEPMGELGRVWDDALRIRNLPQTYINTIVVGVGCVVVAVPIGLALAWCTALLGERTQRVAIALCVLPMLLPPLASVIGWVFVFSRGIGYGNLLLRATPFFDGETGPVNISSLPGILLVTGLNLVPYVFLFSLTALRGIDGRVEDAARVSGASWLGAQARAVFPSIRPSVVYAVVIVLLISLGQFTTVLILGRDSGIDVITTEMYRQTVSYPIDYPVAAFLGIPLIVIAFGLVGLQRRSVGELSRYASTSKGAGVKRRSRGIYMVPVVLFSTVAIVPPIAALVLVSLTPFWSRNVDFGNLTTRHYQAVWNDAEFIAAIKTTLWFSFSGTVLALVLAIGVALFMTRSTSRARSVVDYAVNLPLALPGSLVGMGIFLAFALGPLGLYGSSWLFIIAFVILFVPHGVRMVLGGMAQYGPDVISAGRTCGAGAVRTFFLVQLPLLRRSVAAGGMLYFTLMSHEFAAASLVRTGRHEVLSTQLYFTYVEGTFAQVAVLALVMSAVSAVGVVLMLTFGGTSSFEKV